MRHSVARALGLALAVATLAACANPPEATLEAPVSGGVLVDAGAPTSETAPSVSVDNALPSTTVAATAALPTPSTASTTLAPRATPTTRPPAPAPARTSPPKQSVPPTTELDPIGDGGMSTVPVGNGIEESPSFGDGPRPAFFALSATIIISCADADPGTVRLTWEVIGAETVDIAFGPNRSVVSADQPPAGTLDVPLGCAAGNRYIVIAANAEGETVRSVSVSPN